MRVRLFHKLFVIITVASLASIIAFAIGTHWYLSRSFASYLNEARDQHLSALASELSRHWAQRGDWSGLRDDRHAWRRLIGQSRPFNKSIDDGAPPPGNAGGRFNHRAPPDRFALYDPDHGLIAGRLPFSKASTTIAIKHENETVAWLGAPPVSRASAPSERRFAKRQYQVLSIAAVVAGVLSMVVAFFTARRLAAPIRLISGGARELAGGNFENRLPPLGDDEIGQLAEDFNVLARTLQHNESSRRRWFADASHELRTPLAIMRGELEAVVDGVRPNDSRLVESLSQETGRMEKLIEDLYHLARADIGTLDYQFSRCAVASVIQQVLDRFSSRFSDVGLAIESELDERLVISADPNRLAQAIANILENCYRYVTRPGTITVELKRDGENATLVVEDSGPGVSDDELGHLFEPLSRSETSRNRAFGGSGLGLAICKRIVVAHNGEVSAARSASGGLAVSMRFPGTDIS